VYWGLREPATRFDSETEPQRSRLVRLAKNSRESVLTRFVVFRDRVSIKYETEGRKGGREAEGSEWQGTSLRICTSIIQGGANRPILP
jgi:hypothetical protein